MTDEEKDVAMAGQQEDGSSSDDDSSSSDEDIPPEKMEALMSLEAELDANPNLYDKHIEVRPPVPVQAMDEATQGRATSASP